MNCLDIMTRVVLMVRTARGCTLRVSAIAVTTATHTETVVLMQTSAVSAEMENSDSLEGQKSTMEY